MPEALAPVVTDKRTDSSEAVAPVKARTRFVRDGEPVGGGFAAFQARKTAPAAVVAPAAEVVAEKTESAVAEVAAEAATEPKEPVVEPVAEVPAEKPVLSARSREIKERLDGEARLARERKKFEREQADAKRERDEGIAAREEAKRLRDEATQMRAEFDGAKGNPPAMLALSEKYGVPYQSFMEAGLELTPEKKAEMEREARTKGLESAIAATGTKTQSEVDELKKQLADLSEARAADMIRGFEQNAVLQVKAAAKDFPFTNAMGRAEWVPRHIRQHAAETKEAMDVSEAAAAVEKQAKADLDWMVKVAKDDATVREYLVKGLGLAVPKVAAPAVAAKPTTTKAAPAITNRLNTSTVPKDPNDRPARRSGGGFEQWKATKAAGQQ